MKRVVRVTILAMGFVAFVQAAAGAATNFTATLSGVNETPPNASPATGFGTFVLNDAQNELSFDISYSGLTGGTLSGAHFHNGPAGVAAPIVRGLSLAGQGLSGSFVGVWRSTDGPGVGDLTTGVPPAQVLPLSPALVNELFAERIYFNIHTTPTFPGGEIRAQLVIPEPTTLALVASGIAGVAVAAWRRARQR